MKFSTLVLMVVVLVVAVAMVSGKRMKSERKAERIAARKHIKKNCKYNKKDAVCDETSVPPKRIAQLIPEESADPTNCPPVLRLPCRRKNRMVCRYNKRAAVCDNSTTPPKRTAQLIEAVSDPACPKTKDFRCRKTQGGGRCIYNKQELRTAPCDETTHMKTISLKRGGPDCPQTKEVRCTKGGNMCRYNFKELRTAECNQSTGMKTITLKKGDPDQCARTKQVPCDRGMRGGRRECKYQKGTWSDCDADTNMKTMVKTLKRGDPASCNRTVTEEKMCRGKPKRNIVCKYRQTQWSECDPVSNKKTMIKTLKSGKPSACQPTQTVEKMCKRKKKGKKKVPCKYKKKKWGPCNPHTKTVSRLLMLRKGNIGDCQATKVISRPCRKNKRKKSKTKKKTKGCKYDKSQWGPCDAATNTVTRMLTLKSGDPSLCNATKTDVRKCKDKHLRPHVCKYKRTSWGECDPVTNMKAMVKTLKRGDPAHCEATETVERKCKRKAKLQGTSRVCKYKFEEWSECDIATNTMTRRQIFKSGPSTCQQVKEYSRKCKVPCKFINGEWSECDTDTNQMTRTDTVTGDSADFCGTTRVLTKKCNKKRKRCKYDYGEWGDCDIATNKRTRVRSLISGEEEDCQPEKTVSKTCTKSNGEARCFFGPWQEYDECQNGVQKKKRTVLQGGLECERKGVKMKAC